MGAESLPVKYEETIKLLQNTLGKMEIALGSIEYSIILLDETGTILWCNEAIGNLVEKEVIDILQNKITDILPLRRFKNVLSDDEYPAFKALKNRSSTEIKDFYAFQKGSESLVLEVSSIHVLLSSQENNVIMVVRDVTQQNRTHNLLTESEHFLSSVVENIPNMIFVKDAKDLKFVRINRAGEKLIGLSRQEMIGKSDYDFFPKTQADFFTEQDRATLAKGSIIDIAEEPLLTKKGTRFLHTKKIPLYDRKNQLQYLLGISEDITEKKKAEERVRLLLEEQKAYNKKLEQTQEQLRQRTFQMEAANKELEAFSYSVSHDLRAPLRGISGLSQAVLEDYEDDLDEQGKSLLARVCSETHKMGELIDNILTLSRITRKKLVVQNVDLSGIAHRIAASLKKQDPDRKVNFKIKDDVETQGDPGLLQIALENLMTNSWKFTSTHKTAEIEFGVTEVDNRPTFFIKDDGVGFDMAYASKVFGAFQRLHTEKEFPGTGVGLATVQRVIHSHNGSIWANSEINKGTTFYFTINTEKNPEQGLENEE